MKTTSENIEVLDFMLRDLTSKQYAAGMDALESIRAEFEAMQRVVQAAKDVFAWDRQKEPYLEVASRAEFDEAIADLAAVKSGGDK